MARDVFFYGMRSREKSPKTFLHVKIKKITLRAKRLVNLLCFLLLFIRQYFFITIILSLVYAIYLRSMQLVTQKLTAMPAVKRSRSDARQFQESWTADVFWFVCRNDGAVRTLCSENVACLPPVLNVISKPNAKNYLEMIRR